VRRQDHRTYGNSRLSYAVPLAATTAIHDGRTNASLATNPAKRFVKTVAQAYEVAPSRRGRPPISERVNHFRKPGSLRVT
jgi:hypothetical protein